MPNNLEDLVRQLQAQAGSRGSTFAGRLMPQGDNQSVGDVLSKPPIQELESAGAIDLDAIKSLGGLMAGGGIIKKYLGSKQSSPSWNAPNPTISNKDEAARIINVFNDPGKDAVEEAIKRLNQVGPAGLLRSNSSSSVLHDTHGIAALTRLANDLDMLPPNKAKEWLAWADKNFDTNKAIRSRKEAGEKMSDHMENADIERRYKKEQENKDK